MPKSPPQLTMVNGLWRVPSTARLRGGCSYQVADDDYRDVLDSLRFDVQITSALRHHREMNVTSCTNLAPAGTGTTSLFRALRPHSSQPLTHHLRSIHSKRIEHYVNSSRWRTSICFLLTMRDPAERFITAFNWENHVSDHSSSFGAPSMWGRTTGLLGAGGGPDEWVAALSNVRSPNHASARERFEASRRTPSLVARGLVDPFLVPQVNYLGGLSRAVRHASAHGYVIELHALCTARLDDDWQALVELLSSSTNMTLPEWRVRRSAVDGMGATAAPSSALHSESNLVARDDHRSGRNVIRNAHRGEKPETPTTISNETRRIIRECLYPEDTLLLAMLCGDEGGLRLAR